METTLGLSSSSLYLQQQQQRLRVQRMLRMLLQLARGQLLEDLVAMALLEQEEQLQQQPCLPPLPC